MGRRSHFFSFWGWCNSGRCEFSPFIWSVNHLCHHFWVNHPNFHQPEIDNFHHLWKKKTSYHIVTSPNISRKPSQKNRPNQFDLKNHPKMLPTIHHKSIRFHFIYIPKTSGHQVTTGTATARLKPTTCFWSIQVPRSSWKDINGNDPFLPGGNPILVGGFNIFWISPLNFAPQQINDS